MSAILLSILAQIPHPDPAIPPLTEPSPASSWIVGGLLVACIMLIAFKSSKRNHMDKTE